MRVQDNEEISLYDYSIESIEFNTLNANEEMINHVMIYDVIILEAIFHDVWVECNENLY